MQFNFVRTEHIEMEDLSRTIACYAGCGESFPLRDAVVWVGYNPKNQKHGYFGFCCHEHALLCMDKETMSNA